MLQTIVSTYDSVEDRLEVESLRDLVIELSSGCTPLLVFNELPHRPILHGSLSLVIQVKQKANENKNGGFSHERNTQYYTISYSLVLSIIFHGLKTTGILE